jgi:hypothetical protein
MEVDMDRIRIRRDSGSPAGFEAVFSAGELYFDITGGKLYIFDGSAFVDLSTLPAQNLSAGLTLEEQPATPANPPAGSMTLFCRDNGGKTELCALYDDGSVAVLDVQL